MIRVLTWITAAWTAMAGMAAAEGPVVVELFTSQGCSSCPPADEILGEIAERDDVIALALHVDYWDYIGWKDEFADPQHTVRQRAYSRAAGKRTIYTPQMVIGGRDHIVGTKPMKLADLLQVHKSAPKPATVSLKRNGGRVAISVTAKSRIPNPGAVIYFVTYTAKENVSVRRGENAGRTLTYHNVVNDMIPVGRWDGKGTYSATVRVSENRPVAVLVQSGKTGPILGAAQLR